MQSAFHSLFSAHSIYQKAVLLTSSLLQVIQLQGDQRKNVSTFLVGNKICKKDQVKIHGF